METPPLERDLTIQNMRGLHARAAAKFVKTCALYPDTRVIVCKVGVDEGECVTGSSILGLMSLAADLGSRIHLTAMGTHAEAALEALTNLINDKFGEGE